MMIYNKLCIKEKHPKNNTLCLSFHLLSDNLYGQFSFIDNLITSSCPSYFFSLMSFLFQKENGFLWHLLTTLYTGLYRRFTMGFGLVHGR